MIIRKANTADLGNIMLMYNSCVNGMLKNGIDQWDASYPNVDVIIADLKARTYFVAEENGEIIGGIAEGIYLPARTTVYDCESLESKNQI